MISLEIAGRRYTKFNQYRVSLKFDSIASTFSFNFYDDGGDISKELSKPGKYIPAVVKYGSETLITGVVLSHSKSSEPATQYVGVAGYSTPGVLEDCQIPTSLYPLQSDGKTFKQIVDRLIRPFNLSFLVDSQLSSRVNKVIPVSTADNSESIKSYICELAYNRNLIFSHDEKGALLLTQAKANGDVVYSFTSGYPVLKSTLEFNGQSMHSEITILRQADDDGGNSGTASRKNPYVSVFRPAVKIQTSGDDIDIEEAATRALANELASIRVRLMLDRWIINEKLLRPNTVVSIQNSELGINKPTRFFIEQVDFDGDEKGESAAIVCVLPEVYNGQKPKNIFE